VARLVSAGLAAPRDSGLRPLESENRVPARNMASATYPQLAKGRKCYTKAMLINSRKGFTLIELLIVVAIIGILASVVIVGLGPSRQSARDSTRISGLRQTQTALELYFTKCGYYPGGALTGACVLPDTALENWDALEKVLVAAGIGISRLPHDPGITAGVRGDYRYVRLSREKYVIGVGLEVSNAAAMKQSYVGPAITFGGTPVDLADPSKGTTGGATCGTAATFCLTNE